MRVDELVRSLLRRPVGLLLVVLVAVCGAGYGWKSATTTFESHAVVLIIPPAGAAGGPDANPLVKLDYGIAQLALAVSSQLQADSVKEDVVAAGGSSAFTTDTLSSDNSAVAQLSPQISLAVSAATPEDAQQSARVLVKAASTQLASIQTAANVPATDRATVLTSAAPSEGAAVGNAKVRAAGVLGLAAGFAALLALVALQPLLGGRPSTSRVPRSVVRALIHDDWVRSGRNAPLNRVESRQAWRSAEARVDSAIGSGRKEIVTRDLHRPHGRRG